MDVVTGLDSGTLFVIVIGIGFFALWMYFGFMQGQIHGLERKFKKKK